MVLGRAGEASTGSERTGAVKASLSSEAAEEGDWAWDLEEEEEEEGVVETRAGAGTGVGTGGSSLMVEAAATEAHDLRGEAEEEEGAGAETAAGAVVEEGVEVEAVFAEEVATGVCTAAAVVVSTWFVVVCVGVASAGFVSTRERGFLGRSMYSRRVPAPLGCEDVPEGPDEW